MSPHLTINLCGYALKVWIVINNGHSASNRCGWRIRDVVQQLRGCGRRILRSHGLNYFKKKIDKCGLELSWWSKRNFGCVCKELERKRKLLTKVEKHAARTGDTSRLRQLEFDINSLMDKEVKMWKQRSKVAWLKDGDKNTRFFHSKATQRRRRNYIKGIFDETGQWCTHQS